MDKGEEGRGIATHMQLQVCLFNKHKIGPMCCNTSADVNA